MKELKRTDDKRNDSGHRKGVDPSVAGGCLVVLLKKYNLYSKWQGLTV